MKYRVFYKSTDYVYLDVEAGSPEEAKEIAENTGKSPKEILPEFYSSKTGKALYDEQTRLWCNGPSYIAELYMDELSKRKI